jgi:hypothetical protein
MLTLKGQMDSRFRGNDTLGFNAHILTEQLALTTKHYSSLFAMPMAFG